MDLLNPEMFERRLGQFQALIDEVGRRESAVAGREAELAKRDGDLSVREAGVTRREEAIAAREAEFRAIAQALDQWRGENGPA